MKKSNYYLVKEIIESYEMDDEILNDFLKEFEVGKDISKKDYFEFCTSYMDDMSEIYYVKLNWKYIESGGDESVFDEYEEEDDEEVMVEVLDTMVDDLVEVGDFVKYED